MLFRISRGNAYSRFETLEAPLKDLQTGDAVHKAVFCVLYIGKTLEKRIEKVADFFKAARYAVNMDARVCVMPCAFCFALGRV